MSKELKNELANCLQAEVNLRSTISEAVTTMYLELYKIAQGVLSQEVNKQFIGRHIDIKSICKNYNIEIVEKKNLLQGLRGRQPNLMEYVGGYLDYDYYFGQWYIFIEGKDDPDVNRCTIAYLFSQYLLDIKEKETKIYSFIFNRKMGIEDILSDILASFLLMPIEKVMKVMKAFVKNCENQLLNVYIRHLYYKLSSTFRIPEFFIVSYFEHIKCLAGILYKKNDITLCSINWEEYKEFFF